MPSIEEHARGFAEAWPIHSLWESGLGVLAIIAIAGVLTPITLRQLAETYAWPPAMPFAATTALIALVLPIASAKAWELFRRPARRAKKHGFTIGGMHVGYDEMRTSILVTGAPGSAKTAGVLMPALAQLFETYNEETDDELSRNEFQKIGAFIPEVKGDLVDGCIYLAHEAGRCVSRDVLIITPSCRIPVVRYKDERGRFWYLSGRGGAGGSDAGEILPRIRFPAGHHRAGRLVPNNVFEFPADLALVLPELTSATIAIEARRPRFIGWRWEGKRLCRVSHTVARNDHAHLPGLDGQPQFADPPETLTIDGVVYVDNGIHYNLVDPRLPAAEAAERITRLAAMSRGTGSRGENDYFYEQGRKVIAACISLHRAIEIAQCTAIDIVRLATQDQRLNAALARLAEKIKLLREEASACKDEDARNDILRRQIAPLEDLALFFRDEWQKMVADGKTANIIKSTISGAFDVFLQDPNLAESFCQPATFSFEDIVQSGKIIGLVPGDQYEQLARLIGTACKMDFQSAMLSRNGRPDLNSVRLALSFIDECHKYIISGSSTAGDPYFMNLSRSNNVVNFCATQSYAWIIEVIGREAANVYISAFGVQFWLQQTDPETSRRASEICGMVTREKITADHTIDLGGLLSVLGSGKGMVVRHHVKEEEKDRYRPEDFAHLNVGDTIAYNKGCEGRNAKVRKGKAQYNFCTKKPEGLAAVNARVREYYREVLENLTHERGQSRRWDCGSAGTAVVAGPNGSAAGAAQHGSADTETPRAKYQSVLPLTPGFTVGSRPVVQVSKVSLENDGMNDASPGSMPPSNPPEPATASDAADDGPTPAAIGKEREVFEKYIGSLDACVGDMSKVEPRGLAVFLEEARRRTEKAPRPAEALGETMSLGFEGIASSDTDAPVRPAIDVPLDGGGMPYAGDLATQVAEQARESREKRESGATAKRRSAAPRPKPKAGAFDLKTMRDLIS